MQTINRRRKHLGLAALLVLLISLVGISAVAIAATTHDLTTAGSSVAIDGMIFLQFDPDDSAGTGVFDTFLSIQNSPNEKGYNTDGSFEFDEKSQTKAILLDDVPITYISGTPYREFQLDINESSPLISLDAIQVFTGSSGNITGYLTGPPPTLGGTSTTLIYDMDATPDQALLLNYAIQPGSGVADYIMLLPETMFASSPCYLTDPSTCWVYLYNEFGNEGGDYISDAGFEEWGLSAPGTPVFNPAIDIEKSTSGYVDDVGPGYQIEVGTQVVWLYEVWNTGDVPLVDVVVTDDQIGTICSIPSLAVGEYTTCTVYGTAELGPYENLGTATGNYSGVEVTDTDPSFYTGVQTTAANLVSFDASVTAPSSTLVTWETAIEIDTLGFDVYRSQTIDGLPVQVNDEFIRSKALGESSGATYEFIDSSVEPNTTYYYWLMEKTTDGETIKSEPAEIFTGINYLPLMLK